MFVLLVTACVSKWAADAAQPEDVIQWDTFDTQLEAAAAMEPLLADVRRIAQEVLPIFIRRHWWDLAKRVIIIGHEQHVDVSYAVRRAVSAVKDEADMLVRSLDPHHGVAQEVSPAFMWAQNNTHIFLTIKYSARWNAPGALEVKNPTLVCEGNKVTFTASSTHSKKLYAYKLNLNTFDALRSSGCKFSAASVGKGYILLQKLRTEGEWPRLLASKVRPGNMHLWVDRQHQLDELYVRKGITNPMEVSPYECVLTQQFWCEPFAKCVENCEKCAEPDRAATQPDGNPEDTRPTGTSTTVETAGAQCIHPPSADSSEIQFTDADARPGYIKGEISVRRGWEDGTGKRFGDIFTSFKLYWGLTETETLQPFPVPLLEGDPRKCDLPASPIPDGAQYIIARAHNVLGESENSCHIKLHDFALPTENAQKVSFQDQDVLAGKITGNLTIVRAQNESSIVQYIVYFGKSKSQKIDGGHAQARNIDVASLLEDEDVVVPFHEERVPLKASHFIVYTSNDSGEPAKGVSARIKDVALPCSTRSDKSCVVAPYMTHIEQTFVLTFRNVKNARKFILYSAEEDCPPNHAYDKPRELLSQIDAPQKKKDEAVITVQRPKNEEHRFFQIYVIAKDLDGESPLCTGVKYVVEEQQAHNDFRGAYSNPYRGSDYGSVFDSRLQMRLDDLKIHDPLAF
eukprot:GEMP01029055.1.p1 GENE.GEMP01029055.1~~GEMP01029055.1.p1  ORF type:complete len:684 (+),score=163.89 GEMP01029055.1:148-2199(+)